MWLCFRQVATRTAKIFSARGGRFLGAAVAFYALLSLAPLLLVVLHVAALAVGHERAERGLFEGLSTWVLPEGLAVLRDLLARLEALQSAESAFGIATLLYASTRLFRALKRALNTIWAIPDSVAESQPSGVRYAIRYGLALALALLLAALVLALILLKSAGALIANYSSLDPPWLMGALDLGLSLGVTFCLFYCVFRTLPDRRAHPRAELLGASAATLLFAIGSFAITALVRHKGHTGVGQPVEILASSSFWRNRHAFVVGLTSDMPDILGSAA
jgi:membrane protein